MGRIDSIPIAPAPCGRLSPTAFKLTVAPSTAGGSIGAHVRRDAKLKRSSICGSQHISWFCDLYREWVGRLKPTLRQVNTAGERVFVGFAGHTMEVIEGATGEIRSAQVFVALLSSR